jgi:hypothetical protein
MRFSTAKSPQCSRSHRFVSLDDEDEKEDAEEDEELRQCITSSCKTANGRCHLLPPGPALKRSLIWSLPECVPEAPGGDDPICSSADTTSHRTSFIIPSPIILHHPSFAATITAR